MAHSAVCNPYILRLPAATEHRLSTLGQVFHINSVDNFIRIFLHLTVDVGACLLRSGENVEERGEQQVEQDNQE